MPAGVGPPRAGAWWRRDLAAVIGLGAGGAGASTSGAASGSGHPPSASHASPNGAVPRPTVGGKVTALNGDDMTVQTQGDKSVTVVYSSSTTFRTMSGARASGTTSSSSSAAALKVGDFVGVDGTKNTNGTVDRVPRSRSARGGRPVGRARHRAAAAAVASHGRAGGLATN